MRKAPAHPEPAEDYLAGDAGLESPELFKRAVDFVPLPAPNIIDGNRLFNRAAKKVAAPYAAEHYGHCLETDTMGECPSCQAKLDKTGACTEHGRPADPDNPMSGMLIRDDPDPEDSD